MAYADYAHCAVCDAKVFYDAETNYDYPNFGAMTALCAACVKTHTIGARPRVDDEKEQEQ